MLYMHNIYANIHLFILNSLATKQNHTDFLRGASQDFQVFLRRKGLGDLPVL